MHPMLALFERNAWANDRLLDLCMKQPPEMAIAPAAGDVYGGITAQFTHIAAAETGFLRMVTGERRQNGVGDAAPLQLGDLLEPLHWAAARWPAALDLDRDPDEVYMIQRRTGPAPMTDFLALLQCIHHGDDHRNQVATVLSRHGVEPPELDLWAFGEAFGFERLDMHPGPRARRDSVLRRAFGHHAWATEGLLQRCLELSPEQLALTAPGTYGSILDTFDHMVSSNRSYLSRLQGGGRLPRLNAGSLEPLLKESNTTAERWLAYLDSKPDFDASIDLQDGTAVGAWIITAQALHHGNDHRTHITTTLMHHGLPIPDLDPWDYARAVNALQARA